MVALFNIFKKRCEKKYQLDHSTYNIKQLEVLTKRMDKIDLCRKKHEKFIDSVLSNIDPDLLKRDQDDCYKFLTDFDIAMSVRKALEKIYNLDK